MDQLQNSYHTNAVHITMSGRVVNGSDAISRFWVDQDLDFISTDLIFETNAVYKDDIIYKIETFNFGEDGEQTHLIIQQRNDEDNVRKLEFISPKQSADVYLSIIDQRRAEWIEYCNSHDAEGLVENLYTENAVYYNHRPVKIGRESLTQEYQYMNSPRYSLNLTPLHIEVVNDSIIYEIGQCDGSYNGKYMLVWQKAEDGTWSILMDSNI
jgi:ketosteroid isomerase-like protein